MQLHGVRDSLWQDQKEGRGFANEVMDKDKDIIRRAFDADFGGRKARRAYVKNVAQWRSQVGSWVAAMG